MLIRGVLNFILIVAMLSALSVSLDNEGVLGACGWAVAAILWADRSMRRAAHG